MEWILIACEKFCALKSPVWNYIGCMNLNQIKVNNFFISQVMIWNFFRVRPDMKN